MTVSAEQKLLNKQAAARRSAAYSHRSKEYRQVKCDAEKKLEASSEFAQREKSNDRLNEIIRNRTSDLVILNQKISSINAEIKAIEQGYLLEVEEINIERRKSSEDFNKFRSECFDEIDSRFPDMAGVYTSAAWKPLKDFS